jgi:uncharacterized membrane protein YqjE
MRVLWSLPKATPALIRHIGAYAELLAYDLEQAKKEALSGIAAALVIMTALLFAILMGCAAVIAATWDTPHRLAAIGWLGGGFLALAIIAMIYRSKSVRHAAFLASVREAWKEDSVILQRIVADEEP